MYKSKVLEHCFGEGQPPAIDYSVGRHLVGICATCRKVIRLHANHTMKTHGTWLYFGPDGYQAKSPRALIDVLTD